MEGGKAPPGVTLGQCAKQRAGDKQKQQVDSSVAPDDDNVTIEQPASSRRGGGGGGGTSLVVRVPKHVADVRHAAEQFARGRGKEKQKIEALHSRAPSHASCLAMARVALTQAVDAFLRVCALGDRLPVRAASAGWSATASWLA